MCDCDKKRQLKSYLKSISLSNHSIFFFYNFLVGLENHQVQKGGETILNGYADEKNGVVARESMSNNRTTSASKKNKINKNLKRYTKNDTGQ